MYAVEITEDCVIYVETPELADWLIEWWRDLEEELLGVDEEGQPVAWAASFVLGVDEEVGA